MVDFTDLIIRSLIIIQVLDFVYEFKGQTRALKKIISRFEKNKIVMNYKSLYNINEIFCQKYQ